MKFEWQDIGHHVEKIQTWNPAKNTSAEKFAYIDLSSVDKDKKQIDSNQVQVVTCKDAPSRARQLVKSSDILVSTVRPNLNGVALVPLTLVGATASTGYCVLRANSQTLISEYLFYWVQTKSFIGDMMSKATGANYPAVSDKVIKQSKIPLPPLAEQQKIVAILDAADQLRQKDQQLVEHYTALGQSLFLEMFGDPVSNENKYEVVSLDEVTSKVTDGVHAKPEYTESGVPFISVKDVTTGVLIFDKCKFISEPAHEKYFKRCNPEFGDIIYTKVGATYGRAAIVDVDFQFSMYVSVALIKPIRDLIKPIFLKEAMSNPAIKRQADKAIKGIGVPDLHLNMIKKFTIPLPPVSEQQKFADYVEKIEQQKKHAQTALEKSETLFNSLLQRAFKGELTQSTVT